MYLDYTWPNVTSELEQYLEVSLLKNGLNSWIYHGGLDGSFEYGMW